MLSVAGPHGLLLDTSSGAVLVHSKDATRSAPTYRITVLICAKSNGKGPTARSLYPFRGLYEG